MENLRTATQVLHSGYNPQDHNGTQAIPIYQTSAYVFENTDDAAGKFNLSIPGYIYTRLNNPTNDILEQRLAAIEGGVGAVVTASGAAAISTTMLTLLRTGEHIVSSSSLYGGTYNLFRVTLPRLGITTTFVEPTNPENFDKAIQENTRAIFIEAVGNPKLDITDIEAISKIAQKHKIPLIVDNTVISPALLKPIEYGANIVIHEEARLLMEEILIGVAENSQNLQSLLLVITV